MVGKPRALGFLGCAALCMVLFSSCSQNTPKPKIGSDGLPLPMFPLAFPGKEFLVDYSKYGEFVGEGTSNFKYVIKNSVALKKAAGEGVYPNTDIIMEDPLFKTYKDQGKLGGLHWTKKKDPAAQFYAWTIAPEEWGVRQFFAAVALKDAGHLVQAVKAFYAVIVHFNRSACWAEDQSFVWYVAPAAMTELQILLTRYPNLGIQYEGGNFDIKHGDDLDLTNDVITMKPGRLVSNLIGKINTEGLPAYEFRKETRDSTVRSLALKLSNPGEGIFLDYSKYGRFEGLGTNRYKYVITDTAGLAKAVGEGIYPNNTDHLQNPVYQKIKAAGWLEDGHWKNLSFREPALMYSAWADAKEAPGAKLFYTAEALRWAGELQHDPVLIAHAIKAYHAVLLHYPGQEMMSPTGTYVWYAAKAAINKIKYCLKEFPELGAEYVDPFVLIQNEYDLTTDNDIPTINPGRFVKFRNRAKPNLKRLKIVEQRGKGKVQFVKYSNGHWRMLVNGEPYIIRGVTYDPTKVGESPHDGSLRNWQLSDDNQNGKADSPYDSWVDANGNNKQDADEPTVGDFALLKEMGANTLRFFHKPFQHKENPAKWEYQSAYGFDKKLMRDAYKKYGLRMMVGDFLGAYTVGSGANWFVGTDYRDKKQKQQMKQIVHDLVMDHKDEDYMLMYLLGNENNMYNAYGGVNATKTLASVYPESFTAFLQEIAEMIHEIDPDHPVAIGNLETQMIEYYEENCPGLDVLGINSYRGKEGFGDLFSYCQALFDRPVMITEYGSDNVYLRQDRVEFDDESQREYHQGAWEDVAENVAGSLGVGNAIGACAFEWLDEWWKSQNGPKDIHDETRDSPMAFQDGWSTEEFLGLNGQGLGEHTPYLRQPRKAYYYYKDAWNNGPWYKAAKKY